MAYVVDLGYFLMLCGFITRDVLSLRVLLASAQCCISLYAWWNGVPAIAVWNVVLVCVNVYMAARIVLERRAVALPADLAALYERHFSALSPAEFLRWWRQGQRETLQNAPLARAGERPAWLYFLLDGRARVARGQEEVTELPAGFFVGEMSLLTGRPANADVDAVGTVEVVRWETRSLAALRERHPLLWTRIQSVIGHDLVEKIHLQEARLLSGARA